MKSLYIYSGLCGNQKSHNLLKEVLKKSMLGQSCWWIVDTQSRAELIEEQLLEYSSGAFCGIEIITSGALAKTILNLQGKTINQVDNDLSILLASEVLTEIFQEEAPDQEKMTGWINVFSRVRAKLLDGKKIPEHIRLNYPWIFKASYKFDSLLSNNGLVPLENLPGIASKSLSEEILPEHIVIDNIGPVSHSIDKLLIQLCKRTKRASRILEYLPGNVFAFELIEDNLKKWQTDFSFIWLQDEVEQSQIDLAHRLFNPVETIKVQLPTNKHIYLKYFSNERAEVENVAGQIASLIYPERIGENDIKVICTKLNIYVPLIEEIFPQYGIRFDIRSGVKISDSHLAKFIYFLLKYKSDGYQREDLMNLLLNPYSQWSEKYKNKKQILELDSHLRNLRITGDYYNLENSWLNTIEKEIRKSELNENLENARILRSVYQFISLINNILKRLPETSSGEDFIIWLDDIFKINGIFKKLRSSPQDNPSIINDIKVYGRLSLLLDQIIKTQQYTEKPKWSLQKYFDVLRQEIESGRLNPDLKIRGGIKITGPLELRGTTSKNIFFLGLKDDYWPEKQKSDLLNPFEREWRDGINKMAESRELTLKAINSCQSLYMSVPCKLTSEENNPSSLIDDIQATGILIKDWPENSVLTSIKDMLVFAGKEKYRVDGGQSNLIDNLKKIIKRASLACNAELQRENAEILTKYEGYLNDEKVKTLINSKIRNKPYSVTALENYAKCPMRYLFQRILELDSPEEVEDEVKASEIGTIIHNVFAEAAIKTRKQEGYSPTFKASNEEHKTLLYELALEYLEKVKPDNLLWDIKKEEILSGLVDDKEDGYLKRFLNFEEYDLKNEKIRFVEASYGEFPDEKISDKLLDNFYIENGNDNYEIRGKIDRISYRPDKGWRIWDYKVSTGSLPTATHIKKGYALQLAVYTLVLEKYLADSPEADMNIDMSCLYHFSNDVIKKTGKWAYEKDHLKFRDQLLKNLVSIFKAMENGNFFQPLLSDSFACNTKRSSNYCPYINICIYNHKRFAARKKYLKEHFTQTAYKINA